MTSDEVIALCSIVANSGTVVSDSDDKQCLMQTGFFGQERRLHKEILRYINQYS